MSYHPNSVLRRARVARGLLFVSFLALGTAFFRAQVLDSASYALQAESNRLREVPLPGARGIIYDRKGEIIAENLPGYSVSILSPTEDSLRSALRTLSQVITIDSTQQALALRRYRRAPTRPAVIFNDASFQVVSVLEERRVEFPGLIIQSSPKRYYPDGEAMAALVGYTGEISEDELTRERFVEYKAGQQIGKAGVELEYEEQLRGREGSRFVEVDARNRVVRDAGVRADVQPEAPAPLRTNIDLDLQKYAHDYFGDSLRGAVVAMEPTTGGVLALYSAPSYDINRFIGGVSGAFYQSLLDDEHKPLVNRALQGTYPPASTWKLATAAIGLQLGLVTMDTHMERPCTGGYYYGRVFKCWDKRGHGDVTLAQAIAKSCDVYFYQLGLKIGITRLLAGGVKLGFGEKTGIDLPNERTPTWPENTDYFDRKYGARGWNRSVVLSLSIGQANNAQTPLNMARFYTALATDGSAATPQIVAREPERKQILNLTAEQLAGMKMALADVVSRGTAAGAQIRGLTIAGKTGTAQVPPLQDFAWFVGYAPADDPKIVLAIVIEEGLHGSAAARVATKLMERYLKTQLTMSSVTND
ncbi:penicillin-binding protein 2 [Gemmatimonas aurantiaca T-27]|uniref:Penicillin-binding protein 2 n=1 Tax=Gemmatimonas aurantiaca (strain DSM 14586 / JCM 11422 / NBRC 100505 / T-27) TaxID=379066 RepID=C1A3X5_GEMAT|nr:penicillin-binding protein 2 [Gemmatimonas aurantiaca]BAH38800.1 penicillin-binding protein 2 [Gemmatimonas aurantiaca T-27]